MQWIILSLCAGLFDALGVVALKKIHLKPLTITTLRSIVTIPFLLLALFFYPLQPLTLSFLGLVILDGFIVAIALYFFIQSVHNEDLSLVMPMLSFTPVFLLLTSFILLGEIPSTYGVLGVILITIGVYLANKKDTHVKLLDPITHILTNKYILFMFLAAVLFSIAANFAKIGIQMTNPGFFMLSFYIVTSFLYAAISFKSVKRDLPTLKKYLVPILFLGLFTALMELTAALALISSLVSYVISLKRISVVFSVLLGFFIFKESNLKNTLPASIIIFMGILLISIT